MRNLEPVKPRRALDFIPGGISMTRDFAIVSAMFALVSGCAAGGTPPDAHMAWSSTVATSRSSADSNGPAVDVIGNQPLGAFSVPSSARKIAPTSFASVKATQTTINGMVLTEYQVPPFSDPVSHDRVYPAPYGIAVGWDGNLWFTDLRGASLWRITTSGALTVFPLTITSEEALYDEPENIVAGQDGTLWFTESNASRIGRITTTGVLSEFPLVKGGGGVDTGPQGLAVGPLGAIWFTQPKYSETHTAVGWLTPNGAVSEFAMPKTFGPPFPNQIVLGPDGAFWFTNIDSIGRLTRSGQLSLFPVQYFGRSPFGSGVEGIAVGPGAALWFTELHGNRIGRVTTSGVVTEFPKLPTPESQPYYLTEGPDGALWFTEWNANKVGRMTSNGVITEYPLPQAGSRPLGITVGPDGALWFTESNEIGRKNRALSFSLEARICCEGAIIVLGPIGSWSREPVIVIPKSLPVTVTRQLGERRVLRTKETLWRGYSVANNVFATPSNASARTWL